ncbi:MAG: pseudaminic acid cytidylyltransferase [Clostridium sp.]|jgi:N-acylneuraminate cytidylyltransferase|nr:pseudaminic acid cytidylyltransferase [Clostridium sp.]
MRAIAVIPARGGSKRIPRKNEKEFCGKPILAYSVEAALASELFDTVMVSTEDERIAALAVQYGAQVPFYRSAATAGDYATTSDTLIEVLTRYRKRGEEFPFACCLYPTAPFVTARKLREGFDRLRTSQAEVLIPVVAFSYPIQRALVIRQERLVFEHPQYLDSRSQDLEPHYHDAGQFYFFRVEPFFRHRRLMAGDVLPYEVSELEVQDIDRETDWKLAEIKYRLMVERMERECEVVSADGSRTGR